MVSKNRLTGDDLVELAEVQGKKLGLFAAALDVPEDVKHALIDLMPLMTLPQAERLADVLEAQYLNAKTIETNEELKNILSAMKGEHEAKEKKNREDTFVKIEALGRSLAAYGP